MRAAGSRACLVALAGLGLACSRTRAPAEQHAARPATGVPSGEKRPANTKQPGPDPLETRRALPRLDEGCTAGLDPSPSLVDALKQLEGQCVSSMRPLLEAPALVELRPGTTIEVPFVLADPTGCVRATAAVEPGLAELELGIVDPEGGSHASRTVHGPFALVGPEGPICFDRAGPYRVELRAHQGSGRVAINVWTAL
jgi:hypothetical protein